MSVISGAKHDYLMRNHNVEIRDGHGHAFRLEVSTPKVSTAVGSWFYHQGSRGDVELMPGGAHKVPDSYPTGTWKVLDQGFITQAGGRAVPVRSLDGSARTNMDVYLETEDAGNSEVVPLTKWGIKIFHYEDILSVNDEGTGFVAQPWVLGFDVGKFEWRRLD